MQSSPTTLAMFSSRKFLLFVITCCIVLATASSQECGAERQRRCRRVVLEELERRSSGLSSKELELHCRSIRQNVDCLVWQLTQCSLEEARERSSDVILRGWKYLQSICDAFGGWWQSRCFQRDDVKQCDKHYAGGGAGGGATKLRTSCIEYERFRDCISDIVKSKCEPEDSGYLGSFLLDKAGEMVWRCPRQTQRSQNIYGSRASSAYSSALSADTSFVSGCNARASEEIRGCRDRHQYERDQSLGSREPEERERRACCASWNYRRCFENAIRTHCYDSREVVFPGATGLVGHERDNDCLDYWRYTCSAAGRISMTSLLVLLVLVLLVKCVVKYVLD